LSIALILSTLLCSAQTCPDDVQAKRLLEETLADMYQPRAYDPDDQTEMHRFRFKPDPAIWGPGPYPTVLMLPAAVFRDGYDDGNPKERVATKDLTDAGFLVFQIEHRLAPDGLLFGQHAHDNTPEGIASGRPPQQSNDVKQQVLAAQNDSQCNGKIFLIGGSSGGTHAMWAALDPNPTVLGWNATIITKIKAVVGLSGVYDLSLRNTTPPPTVHFIDSVQNYTNTTDSFVGLEYQLSVSPIGLFGTQTYVPPARFYATQGDSVPFQEAENMVAAMLNWKPGLDVASYKILNSSLHAFNYWHELNTAVNPPICVSTQVIAFLNAHK
jgi:acetyl esterase/lipase